MELDIENKKREAGEENEKDERTYITYRIVIKVIST